MRFPNEVEEAGMVWRHFRKLITLVGIVTILSSLQGCARVGPPRGPTSGSPPPHTPNGAANETDLPFVPGNWVLQQEASDHLGQEGDLFGKRLALSNQRAIIASPDFGLDTSQCQGCRRSQGKISLYQWEGGSWALEESLEGADWGELGSNVFLSEEWLLVGLRGANEVWRYSRAALDSGGLSALKDIISNPNVASFPFFGGAMAASSTHLVIASFDALHLYDQNNLSSPLKNISSSNGAGLGFDLYQNELLVGDDSRVSCYSSQDDFVNPHSELSSHSLGFDPGAGFGSMLAHDENWLSISASNQVHLFERQGHCDWVFRQTLEPLHSLPHSQFGSWLSMSGGLLAVASQGDPYPGNEIFNFLPPLLPEVFFAEEPPQAYGSVTVYSFKENNWIPTAYFNSPHPSPQQRFGRGISLSGNRMLVGTELSSSLGKAYFYELQN